MPIDLHNYRALRKRMPGRISDEVGQSTLQEACIYSTGRITVNMQLKVSIVDADRKLTI